MTSTPGIPFERYSPDGAYLIIEPGVESNQWKYDSPVAGEASTMGIALDGLNRFVTKTLPAGPIGDVVGPAGATDNAVARYDGVTGKLIQNSVVTISDAGGVAGATTLNGSAIPIPIGDVVGPAGATDNAVPRYDGVTGKLIQDSAVTISDAGAIAGATTLNGSAIPSPIGDVVGPAGATDNAIARYDGVTGKLIQDSAVTISDAGAIAGATTLNGSPIPSPIGDVVGPAGATDNAVARYDGVTGKLIQNSSVTISDAGDIAGATTLNGSAIPSLIGDVVGPAGATNKGIARYDGSTGKLIQDSSVRVLDTGVVDISTPTGGVVFPNLDAISAGPEMKNWQIFGGAQTWTGPWLVPKVGLWDVERIGNRAFVEIGLPAPDSFLNDGAASVISTTVPLPSFAIPTVDFRKGVVAIRNAGVYGVGLWETTPAGLIIVHPTTDPTSVFIGGSIGLTGIPGSQQISFFVD